MKHIPFIVFWALLLLCGGCTSTRTAEKEQVQKLDSIKIEYKEFIAYVRDTVYFEIPKQVQELIVKDSVSVLENDFATSSVRIHKNGTITHNLRSKPQQVAVPYLRQERATQQSTYKEKMQEAKKETERSGSTLGHRLKILKNILYYTAWALAALLLMKAYKR